MRIKVLDVKYYVHNTRTRMPFHFGIVKMTAAPHFFLLADVLVDGVKSSGLAAEGLLPKWFTKNPDSSFQDEIKDMIEVIRSACRISLETDESDNFFRFWQAVYRNQKDLCEAKGQPSLLWNFGISMVERAVLDAICKAKELSLKDLLADDALGIEPGEIHAELKGTKVHELLDLKGVNPMYARHTVGLTDFLRQSEIPHDERVDDGLPQALEDCVKAYGISRLKIKLSGTIERDTRRLVSIAHILEENGIEDYAFTLDGNENYDDANDFVKLWEDLIAQDELGNFLSHLIFVEQPIKRTAALSEATKQIFLNWKHKPLMIIDESDSELDSMAVALESGYEGTSHKNCKGIIKGIANACLLKHKALSNPTRTYLLSGEDLVNIGPVALLQDLTVSSLLGVTHIERNGHHYFRGLSMFPLDIQEQVLEHHGDLYRRHEDGFVTLNVADGCLNITSLLEAPFGLNFDLDPARFTSLSNWTFESL